MAVLEEIATTIGNTAERTGPAVVGLGRGWHPGSGVVIAPGQVLTSAHNLRREEVAVAFAGGRTEAARVAGVDPALDVAVLAVETGDVEPVEWSTGEDAIAIGTPVLALANPGGRGLRVSHGFVTAAERSVRGTRGRRIEGCIEHSAPLPRGSSGGPLLDAGGHLIGLNAIRLEGGLIVATPAGAGVRERIESLARGESTTPVRLGVAVAPAHVARRLRRSVGLPERDGVLVRAVEDESAADRAGIQRGDLIVAAGGREVDGVDALYDALDTFAGRGKLELTLLRGDEQRDATVEFGESDDRQEVTP
jgi:S1-C subfamily serine protease